MGNVEIFREALKNREDWDAYLLDESGLPGPRANLELVEAVAQEGDLDRFRRYLAFDPVQAPYGSAREFFPVCGIVGLGRLLAQGQTEHLDTLRLYASDPRWRVREGVAMALQKFGDVNMDGLLKEMEKWSKGQLLEKRAAAAAVCEPRLLKKEENVQRVLSLLDQITEDLTHEENRKTEDFRVLRKALGYCWSVALVAGPREGKSIMEKWFVCCDPDIRWIMMENSRKNRLIRLDPAWVERWQDRMNAETKEK